MQYRTSPNRSPGQLTWLDRYLQHAVSLVAQRLERDRLAEGESERRDLAEHFSDITERRRHQQALAFQAQLLDAVGQAVIATDPSGQIIYWNRAAERIYGWTKQEALGRPITEVTVDAQSQVPAAEILDTVRSGRAWSGRFDVTGKHGTVPALVTNTPVFDDDGQFKGIIGVSVDISEFEAAQRPLKDADRRKDEFLATLGHELRNPLAAIRTALHLMQHIGDDLHRVEELTAVLDRQSMQLVRLVDDLLDVSRISRGRISLAFEPLDLSGVISQALENVRPFCVKQHLQLHVFAPDQPVMVFGDHLRLVQVLGNLLHNACKYTPASGQVHLVVEPAWPKVTIRVQDTGVGIPHQQLSRIFDVFTQIDRGKQGSVRTCHLNPKALRQAEDWLANRRALWEGRLDRLEALLQALIDGPYTGTELEGAVRREP